MKYEMRSEITFFGVGGGGGVLGARQPEGSGQFE